MKKLTVMLILAILSLGSVSAFADGDAWSTIQAANKAKKADKKADEKKDDKKKKEEKEQSSNN